jgi:cephalosporin-C deacetylase-like acetyl esterase
MAKRKAPKMTKETIKKILANPKTPAGLKAYWRKRLANM